MLVDLHVFAVPAMGVLALRSVRTYPDTCVPTAVPPWWPAGAVESRSDDSRVSRATHGERDAGVETCAPQGSRHLVRFFANEVPQPRGGVNLMTPDIPALTEVVVTGAALLAALVCVVTDQPGCRYPWLPLRRAMNRHRVRAMRAEARDPLPVDGTRKLNTAWHPNSDPLPADSGSSRAREDEGCCPWKIGLRFVV